jgi:hypothetical protein
MELSGQLHVRPLYHQGRALGKIKNGLKSVNICYHSVRNLSHSYLLSDNVKIQKCKTTILNVVAYGDEARSVSLREEHRLRELGNRVLRRYTDIIEEAGKKCIMRSFIICTFHRIL